MSDPASERVMRALETQLTTWLVAEFGSNHAATRDFTADPSGEMPENCPAVWILEGLETLRGGNQYDIADRSVTLYGLLRKNKSFPEPIPTQCNRMLAVLDQLWNLTVLEGINVAFVVDGPRTPFAGADEGLVQFPVILSYPREA